MTDKPSAARLSEPPVGVEEPVELAAMTKDALVAYAEDLLDLLAPGWTRRHGVDHRAWSRERNELFRRAGLNVLADYYDREQDELEEAARHGA